MMRVQLGLEEFVSPYADFCTGYQGQGGYVLGLVLAIGLHKARLSHDGSQLLDEILAYDQAEVEDTYLGQINMIQVSSFCGPEGVIWGYDLASSLDQCPQLREPSRWDGQDVRRATGLRYSTRALLGTRTERRFPLLPGSHVPCATKYRFFAGPGIVYAAAAIGVPRERDREACLLMEDVGYLSGASALDSAWEMAQLDRMTRSVHAVGRNQLVEYGTIFVDVVTRPVEQGEIACALVAAPYMKLARSAYLPGVEQASLAEWLDSVRSRSVLDG